MTNNDIIRQLRFIYDFSDTKMMQIFEHAGFHTTRSMVSNWLKKEEDEQFCNIEDPELAYFLNGMIIKNRGRQDGSLPKAEDPLTNNMILRKLKIALELKSEDILSIIGLTGMNLGKHELSAFFRNPKQNQYRPCKDQVLRKFLYGLKLKMRNDLTAKD